jgi:hypothetical protein
MLSSNTEYAYLFASGYAFYEFVLCRYFRDKKKWSLWQYPLLIIVLLFATIRYSSISSCVAIIIFAVFYFILTKASYYKNPDKKYLIESFFIKNVALLLLLLALKSCIGSLRSIMLFDTVWNFLMSGQIVDVKKSALLVMGFSFVVDGGTSIVRNLMLRFPVLKSNAMAAIHSNRHEDENKNDHQKSTRQIEPRKNEYLSDKTNVFERLLILAVIVWQYIGESPRTKEEKNDKELTSKDNEEERAGELIGIIERLLIVAFVIVHSYEAVAFVVAAKSIARFRLLDDKDFAEYYLLGTTLSVVVAVAIGLCIMINFH